MVWWFRDSCSATLSIESIFLVLLKKKVLHPASHKYVIYLLHNSNLQRLTDKRYQNKKGSNAEHYSERAQTLLNDDWYLRCSRVNTVLALCIVGLKVRWKPPRTCRSPKHNFNRDCFYMRLLLSLCWINRKRFYLFTLLPDEEIGNFAISTFKYLSR